MKMKIRKGDRVMVKRGGEDDKGKIGEVIRVIPASNRIVVQGVNLRKKAPKTDPIQREANPFRDHRV